MQTVALDVVNLQRAIEQLEVKQDQIGTEHSKAIEQLKAKQEDMARQLAKVSEQSGPSDRVTASSSAGSRCEKVSPTQSPQAGIAP